MRRMKLEDIKISGAFAESVPSEKKILECSYYWDNFHMQDRYLVINNDGYLIDGYVMYCVLKERGETEAVVKISSKRKKRWYRKNTKDWTIPHYRNEETTYIYGVHHIKNLNTYSKEYVWRVPKSWSENGWENDLLPGDSILVNAKEKVVPIVITKIERSDKCPVEWRVKRVVGKCERK